MVGEGSGGTPESLGGVGRDTQKSGLGRETHPVVWVGSGGTPVGQGGFRSLSQRSWIGREANLECRERSEAHL